MLGIMVFWKKEAAPAASVFHCSEAWVSVRVHWRMAWMSVLAPAQL